MSLVALEGSRLSSHRQDFATQTTPDKGIRSAWPLTALLVGFPVWWALGLGSFVLPLLALPMTLSLLRLRKIELPPAFGWWALFLLWVVASGMMLSLTAPDTLSGSFAGRLPSFGLRLVNYGAATVVMLFVLNLDEHAGRASRIIRAHSWFFVAVVMGGVAATLYPSFSFVSPMELLLPNGLASNRYVGFLVHPHLSQVQEVLGYESPRPSAPFPYTNIWGNNLSILLVWFVVSLWVGGSTRSRLLCSGVLGVALVPIIYSLNRGLWIGLFVALIYVAGRAGLQGKAKLLGGLVLGVLVISLVVAVSPLSGIIADRLDNPHSNEARANTSLAAVTAAASSPVLGYGSTRTLIGSDQSIAVGRSPDCPQCGNAAIGGAGQLWLLLIAQGFVGAFLYIGFFVRTIWIYRHDRDPVVAAGVLILILSLVYLTVYGAEGVPLALYLLAVALMARKTRQDSSVRAGPESGVLCRTLEVGRHG